MGSIRMFSKSSIPCSSATSALKHRVQSWRYQMVSVGAGKEVSQRPDHPDVFFQQMGQQARCVGGRVERVQAFRRGELEELSYGTSRR
jgi:hypothetical protein